MSGQDAAAFLAGSTDRHRLLAHLRDEPGGPRDVADALDVSRRSVQRNLAEFRDREWVEKRDGAYHLTTTGDLVARTHAAYVESLSVVVDAEPFLRNLPDADRAPDPAWLRDADVVAATSAQPQAPVSHYVDRVRARETNRIRMLAPVLSRLFHDAHAELVLSGVDTELVLARDAAATARAENPLEFRVVASAVDLYEHDGPVDVGLTLGDDWLLACAYDDEGQLRAVVESENPDLLAWGEDRYETYRDGAERVRL